MEITQGLQEDVVKIQNELITAIQNHQVLVLRQQVIPSESIKTQIEEVQRHIICLGESQKILVNRIRNELELQDRTNNKLKTPPQQRPHKAASEERHNKRQKNQDLSRSLLIKNINKERSLLKSNYVSGSDKVSEQNNLVLIDRQPSVDSSSEENRTPCNSPINGSSECIRPNVQDNERHGVKRTLSESHRNNTKRPKSTLQATPRPSSPVPARSKALDALSSSSEESLDSLLSQQPESENKIDFALALGLVTMEVYEKVIQKKSERRRRRVSNHHHLYNDLWDLTVFQKRTRVKGAQPDDADDNGRDCETPQSDSEGLCFICQKPGELRECIVCQTGCHTTCVRYDICPACTNRISLSPTSPRKMEKKKELEQLKSNSKELHKSVSKLRERAKVLSASLVAQTATVNHMITKEDRIHESIKKLKDFLAFFQGPRSLSPRLSEAKGPTALS